MTKQWHWLFAAALSAICAPAIAAPFVPADDAQVLERLPDRNTAAQRELKRLREAVSAAPKDVAVAVALAEAYYRVSRSEGDPRYLGYAQAALAPWWNDPQAPSPVLVTRATILQSNHEFSRALTDLDLALKRDARNARALLVRATVLVVQGNHDAARGDCRTLRGLVAEINVAACLAGIDAITGKAQTAKTALERAAMALPNATPDTRAWVESLLGEIAQRQNDAAAEQHFRAALAADPRDLYTLGAYSDWLLERNRALDVIPLVQNEARVDALLLRLALAQKALQRADAAATIATLRARFDASRARGDTVHRREEARFQLALLGDAQAALRLARENWKVQREPADVRVLAEVARATGDAWARETVRQWLATTGLEYPAVATMVNVAGSGK